VFKHEKVIVEILTGDREPENAQGLTKIAHARRLKANLAKAVVKNMELHHKETYNMEDFSFDVHIFKEGDTYVAYVPSLDVSSCGATDDEARRNIRDAVRGFLASSSDLGTLDEILEEAGYERRGEEWVAPEFVSVDRLTMSLK
jgi:predicted RNase H-like HicB family nuclease